MAKKSLNAVRKTRRIAEADHVARHLGPKHLEYCQDTGKVIGVLYSGFLLRAAEKELSVNHLQYFPGTMLDQVKGLKSDMVKSGFTVRPSSAYGVLEVGHISDCGKKAGLSLTAFKRPMPGNPSHAEILGLPADNGRLDLLEDLARTASKTIFQGDGL